MMYSGIVNVGIDTGLSTKGEILVHGQRCPILGRVCMDQTMIDLTDVKEVATGDQVTLIGNNEGETVTLREFSTWANSIPWEILCSVTKRVPRHYRL